nr:MAG TPA: hypothetical protein [Caudoviricetes sp.]
MRGWGLSVFRTVESVGPDEPVQQSARGGVRLLVDDGNEGDLEDGVGEVGVHGETGEARPNARVAYRVLVGVVPSVGNVQRFNGADAAGIGDLVQGPGLASARSMDLVDSTSLDGLEGGVISAVDGGAHFLFPPWPVGLLCWCKNILRA